MARGSRAEEILEQTRRQRGEERRKEVEWQREMEGVQRGGGGVAGDWPPQHFRCMSEALRLNQIFTCLPPLCTSTKLPYLPPCVPLSLSLFLPPAVSIPQPRPPASDDNRIILPSCSGCHVYVRYVCCVVWGLCSSGVEITPRELELAETEVLCIYINMQTSQLC